MHVCMYVPTYVEFLSYVYIFFLFLMHILHFYIEAIGGKKGGDVMIALQAIADGLDDSFIGSLDYSLAFDSLVPELIVALFQHVGLPRGGLSDSS